MRKILAFALAAAFLAVAFTQWHFHRAAAMPSSSVSQIFIHGTPVCIYKQGEEIAARVGRCPSGFGEESEGPVESAPFHGHPGMGLPPGHPPIDRDMAPDDRRRVLI